ncbi:MAG: glycine-rich protein, partial [Patulibacter sp.]
MPLRPRRLRVIALSTACFALGPVAAADAVTVTKSFPSTGAAQAFDVPTGITEVEVTAVGGRGGGSGGEYGESADRVPGGFGGRVTGTLTVTSGSRLWVAVGGNGAAACPSGSWDPGSPGGWNGGAAGGTASCGTRGGSGGGASDIRTCEPGTECPDEPGADPLGRLLIAAGGGGTARWANAVAGAGGNAEAAGGST